MKLPIRTTVALDEKTAEILGNLRSPGSSQSDVIRRALKLYNLFKEFGVQEIENLKVYSEMLSGGEHVILDLDHFISFLGIVEESPNEKFWETHRMIAKNHAEQFRNMDVEQILKRLEACNFFRLVKSGEDNALVFGNDNVKKFMRLFLDEIFSDLHKDVEIKEGLSKLRIKTVKKLK